MLAVITNASDLFVTVPLSMRREESFNANLYHHSSLQHELSILGIKGDRVKERNNDIQFILTVAEPLVILHNQIFPEVCAVCYN